MERIGQARAPLIGAIVGVAATLLGAWLAGPDGRHLPYVVLLVLAIGIVGLGLGALAALAAYVAGATTVFALVLLQPGGVQTLGTSDLVRNKCRSSSSAIWRLCARSSKQWPHCAPPCRQRRRNPLPQKNNAIYANAS